MRTRTDCMGLKTRPINNPGGTNRQLRVHGTLLSLIQIFKESLFIAQAEHAWINFIGCLVTNYSFLLMLVREDG